ncbi:MAG: hypothetical protein ACRDTP_00870 [Mycobacteriales bacterium]
MIKKAYAAGIALAAVALAGCGSSSPPAAPDFVQQLKAPPATVPPDYTSVAAIVHQLEGVATCTPNGPQSEVCTLVTSAMNSAEIATVKPFQVKVFATPDATQAYLRYVHGVNVTYAKDGSPVRRALTGPHWVVTPQSESADIAARLKPYLGGTITQ